MSVLIAVAHAYPPYVYAGFVALSFLPPLVWLLFYLREDRHPEPKHLLLLTFIAGILSAVAAVFAELALFGQPPVYAGFLWRVAPRLLAIPALTILGVAFIEELLKYLAVRIAVLRRPEFDEPIDAMIYMITAALGFAALENVFFLIPAFEAQGQFTGFELTVSRFFGANLLHALSSALVGYAVAKSVFGVSRRDFGRLAPGSAPASAPGRGHLVGVSIAAAAVLHALFNYFIITRDIVPGSFTLLIFLLSLMAVVVFIEFERLKRQQAKTEGGKGKAAA